MPEILAKRITAKLEQPVVVFLIGMRLNKPFALKKWRPIINAFPQMVRTLQAHPETGMLHAEQFFRLWPLVTCMVSYWQTYEQLEAFAHSKDEIHFAAWRDFNKAVGTGGEVGIWHETYTITPGQYEGIYVNMPIFGMAGATMPIDLGVGAQSGRDRGIR